MEILIHGYLGEKKNHSPLKRDLAFHAYSEIRNREILECPDSMAGTEKSLLLARKSNTISAGHGAQQLHSELCSTELKFTLSEVGGPGIYS
jgi:hypothetical protein